jgi:hypothetical protein
MEKVNAGIPLFVITHEFGTPVSTSVFCNDQFKTIRYPGKEFNGSRDSDLKGTMVIKNGYDRRDFRFGHQYS